MNNEEKLFELMNKMYADLKGSQERMYAELKGSQEHMYADLKDSQERMYADLKGSQERMYADLKGSQEHMYTDLKSSQERMHAEMYEGFNNVNNRLDKVEDEVRKTNNIIENDITPKIEALFDGYTLRGDQIEHLQNHLNERLDTIQTDLSYLLSKTAQHERKFIQLNKADASRRFSPQK